MDKNIELALELMVYGIGGVFLVLIIFFIVIKVLNFMFPQKEDTGNKD